MQTKAIEEMLAGHVIVHPYSVRDIEDLIYEIRDDKSRWVLKAIAELVRRGTHPEAVTVGAIVGMAAIIGYTLTARDISEYTDDVYSDREWGDRVAEFRDGVTERKTRDLVKSALSDSTPGVADRLSQIIDGVTLSRDGSCADGDVSMTNLQDELNAMVETGATFVQTGFRSLDEGDYPMPGLVNPLRPGQQVIIGARPSVGKTAFAISLMTRMSARSLYFTKEMSYTDISARAFAQITETPLSRFIDLDKWRSIAKQLPEWKRFYKDQLQKYQIYKSNHFTLSDIRAAIIRYKPEVVFIDYIQNMTTQEKGQTRNEAIGHVSRSLKDMALKYGVVTVVLSQLGRSMSREQREPLMSDLRESGDLENDADLVMLIDRAVSDAEINTERGITMESAMVYVRKQRNGRTGQAGLRFIPELVKFDD